MALRKTAIENEFNNDFTGPAGVGYGGNEDSLVRPLIDSGMGHGGSEADPSITANPGGMGRAGSEELPAPNRLGGDGRAGLPDTDISQAPTGELGRRGSISQPGGPQQSFSRRHPDHERTSSAQGTVKDKPVPMSLEANGE